MRCTMKLSKSKARSLVTGKQAKEIDSFTYNLTSKTKHNPLFQKFPNFFRATAIAAITAHVRLFAKTVYINNELHLIFRSAAR